MFTLRTASHASRTFSRAFSATSNRGRDMARLTLIGNLAKDPEARLTKNEKEFVVYTIVTNGPNPPSDANGERKPPPATFHRVLSFNDTSNKYLRTLKKGSKVFAETAFELREPETGADPTTPQGQRQIFLRHETIRLLASPKSTQSTHSSHSLETSETSGY